MNSSNLVKEGPLEAPAEVVSMTRWITRSDAIQASLFTTLGALLLFGALSLPFAAPIVAVGLVVLAVLVFAGAMEGPWWLGLSLLFIGALMLVANPVGRFLSDVLVTSLQVLAGGLLVALGILKLSVLPRQRARPFSKPHREGA